MFAIRNSEKLHIQVTLFSISVGKEKYKYPQNRRRRREEAMERKMLRHGGPQGPVPPFFPFMRSATGARWLCAFLKHQLPEWSCREAMHCGTGVSAFLIFFFFVGIVSS